MHKKNLIVVSASIALVLGAVALFLFLVVFDNAETQIVVSEIHTVQVPDPGALVNVSMEGVVGVLLDEIPAGERNTLVQTLKDKPEVYWTERAIRQVRFTSLRRNFGAQYGAEEVPLPPEDVWQIKLLGTPSRERVDGHDVVVVTYRYEGTILTDLESPGVSAEELGTIGGTWMDELVLPIDPDFVFQRTGFACMNESQSPPNSIDAEQAWFFYDQKCDIEDQLSNIGCHQSELPTESCVDAVQAHIGTAYSEMLFERIPWNAKTADAVRVGKITNEEGPDLSPIQERFQEHRVTYRYISQDSCTLVEACVGGSGWRQLLLFPTGDVNTGSEPLDIGRVDYFHQTDGTLLSKHGVYEFSACHEHYHFRHYGSFSLGNGLGAINRKQAFCLQPTARLMNTEESPMNHPYANCIDQGVEVGWLDEYVEGLECQWLDITDVPAERDVPITFISNPDGMMCEGTRQFDDEGHLLFESTKFKTEDGQPVDKAQCDFTKGWDDNNTITYDLDIPPAGEGYVTEPCEDEVFGLLRNCDLHKEKKLRTCEPGSEVNLHCEIPVDAPSQIVRVCEASRALNVGIPCTYSDALSSSIIASEGDVAFTCPAARDETETGGVYSLLVGALFQDQGTVPVTCVTTE